ncbi:MAG TPA: hypothetical protein ENN28_00880 [Candidatus Uhrbacteria bacterium]|nr:hypothetical protein [Candidatus Uhrbacteria bacterium]
MKRKIIEINEQKCNGCGLCVGICAEAALEIIDEKAKLVKSGRNIIIKEYAISLKGEII